MSKITRKYHHYEKWEDYQNGMYSTITGRQRGEAFTACLDFMSSSKFYEAMEKVIYEWPYSCEQNLTNQNSNRVAWLGQAACTIELGAPEDIVRQAWGKMDLHKRQRADKEAEKLIKKWEIMYEGQNWQIRFFLV